MARNAIESDFRSSKMFHIERKHLLHVGKPLHHTLMWVKHLIYTGNVITLM